MITVVFNSGETRKNAKGLWQYDYGQVLRIQGLPLPPVVEIHFALQEKGGSAVTRIGATENGITDVVIPDSMLKNENLAADYKIYAWIYLADEESGETKYMITLSVKSRPKPETYNADADTPISGETMAAILEAVNRIAAGSGSGEDTEAFKVIRLKEDGELDLVNWPYGCGLFRIVAEEGVNIQFIIRKTDNNGDIVYPYNGYFTQTDKFVLINQNIHESYEDGSSYNCVTMWDIVGYKYWCDCNEEDKDGNVTWYGNYSSLSSFVEDEATTKCLRMYAANTTMKLQSNTFYVWPEMTSLTLTLRAPENTSVVNEYHWMFTSGATPTELVLPDTVRVPSDFVVEANKIYEMSVLENCLTYQSWDTVEAET